MLKQTKIKLLINILSEIKTLTKVQHTNIVLDMYSTEILFYLRL